MGFGSVPEIHCNILKPVIKSAADHSIARCCLGIIPLS